mmetsp:Transcript_26165/g.35997  ORF Transcript_26165/g.35997 Transcript_26165/m.35997 type:complete len:102 (+) Transcript_26165:205-510(+)
MLKRTAKMGGTQTRKRQRRECWRQATTAITTAREMTTTNLMSEASMFDNPSHDRLVQSGGGFEQVEVVLTDLLLMATRTGRDAEAVRALGERLTKAKWASL